MKIIQVEKWNLPRGNQPSIKSVDTTGSRIHPACTMIGWGSFCGLLGDIFADINLPKTSEMRF
jgi:hypothetical protein